MQGSKREDTQRHSASFVSDGEEVSPWILKRANWKLLEPGKETKALGAALMEVLFPYRSPREVVVAQKKMA